MALVTANQFQLTPDFGGAISSGLKLGKQISQALDRPEIQKLTQQALGGDQQALQSLASLAPDQANKVQQFHLGQQQQQAGVVKSQQVSAQQQQQADKDRLQSVIEGAVQLSSLPDDASKLNFLKQRKQQLTTRGIATQDTDEIIGLFESGQSDQANALINSTVKTGERLGFVKPVKAAAIESPTSLQKNLLAAGLQPGTPEFQAAILKSTTKPLIGSGEPEEKKALARQRVKRFGEIQTAADQATTLLDNLNQIDAIVVETGALEPAKAAFAAVIEGFGIDASEIANATGAQAVNAITGRLLNDVLNAATGPQTDQDATRARKTIANLGNTPGAFKFKNDSLRSLALRQIEQRDFIAGQLDEDKNLSQANKAWREFKRKTPSLSAVVKDSETGLPLFFFQFKNMAKERRSGISDQEIIKAWRGAHGK